MTVSDDELSLITDGWYQTRRGRWSHAMYREGARLRTFTLDAALIEAGRLLAQRTTLEVELAALANPAIEWCGIDDEDAED